MESNYDKQVYIARELFCKYDQDEIIRKFNLKNDVQWLYLRFLDYEYRIARKSGEIACRAVEVSADGTSYPEQAKQQDKSMYMLCLDYDIVMMLYDLLCYSETTPVLAHEWVPLHALQVTMSSPETDTFTGHYAKMFAEKADILLQICRKLGGVQPQIRAGADVCWQFSVFDCFPVQMRFWDGDDEFEPQIQLLWDKNTLDFMHFETVYYVQRNILQRLSDLLEEWKG